MGFTKRKPKKSASVFLNFGIVWHSIDPFGSAVFSKKNDPDFAFRNFECILQTKNGGRKCPKFTYGLVIVHTPDVTLVCSKDSTEKIKVLLNQLREKNEMKGYL